MKCVHIAVYRGICESLILTCELNTPQPCRQSTKLRTMIISVLPKIVVKFEASEMMCVELRAKKL